MSALGACVLNESLIDLLVVHLAECFLLEQIGGLQAFDGLQKVAELIGIKVGALLRLWWGWRRGRHSFGGQLTLSPILITPHLVLAYDFLDFGRFLKATCLSRLLLLLAVSKFERILVNLVSMLIDNRQESFLSIYQLILFEEALFTVYNRIDFLQGVVEVFGELFGSQIDFEAFDTSFQNIK